MTEKTVTDNGLPVEAQPWVRKVERFMRDEETNRQILAKNGEQAIIAAGTAVTSAANSAAAQAAALAEQRRIPATLDATQFEVTPSTYFDSTGRAHGRFDVEVMPSDLDVDGNPLIPVSYHLWGRVYFDDLTLDEDDKTSIGVGPNYQLLGMSPSTVIRADRLQVGVEYQLRVSAISAFSVSSALSDYVTATTPATLEEMAAPDAPAPISGAGMLVIPWDGTFNGALPPAQFRYVFAEVSPAGQEDWKRMGNPVLRGGGSIQISGLSIGAEYDVRLIAVDSLNVQGEPSPVVTVTITGINTADLAPDFLVLINASGNQIVWSSTEPDFDGARDGDTWFQHDENNRIIGQWLWTDGQWTQQTLSHEVIASIDLGTATVGTLDGGLITARTLGAEQIVAGTLTVNELSPTIGEDINIRVNGDFVVLAGQVDSVSDGLDSASDSLKAMQTRYSFGEEGLVISNPPTEEDPGSRFELALRADRVEMLEQGRVVSTWNAGQMIVNSFVGNEVVLGKHKLEALQDGTGTVVRAL